MSEARKILEEISKRCARVRGVSAVNGVDLASEISKLADLVIALEQRVEVFEQWKAEIDAAAEKAIAEFNLGALEGTTKGISTIDKETLQKLKGMN